MAPTDTVTLTPEPEVDSLILQSNPSVAFRVKDKLWIGNAPPIGHHVAQHFEALVLSAIEYQPVGCFPKVSVMGVQLRDDGSPMTRQEMELAVKAAGRVIQWLKAGKSVLVTCHMGLNRSGLICALALCKGPAGMKPGEAVRTVRAARGPDALRNRDFLRFLSDFCTLTAET